LFYYDFALVALTDQRVRRDTGKLSVGLYIITFRVSGRRREMYIGHARLSVCVSVCLSAAACPHYCMDRDVTWGNGRGYP